ncbi:MAG: transposase [Bacteroidia bacterium]|nr:transposase [Bacteroidia bacterium]
MPRPESTNIFSEISTFFRENDDDKAIRTIMDVAKHLKLSAKTLDMESRWNCKYTRLQVFELLLLFPLFMVKNAYRYTDSTLAKVVPCKKDVFYRFMENGSLDWRMILYRINRQLLAKILLRDDSLKSKEPVCLIIDDTDLPKTGAKMEKIGRIFSHVTHASLLGFKALFLCRTDGKTQTVLDFSLHGEEGRRPDKPFGMTKKQRDNQYSKVREQDQAVNNRIGEYTQSKIQKAIDMVKHAISQGIRFDYLLADSWFTCTDIVKFIKSRHSCCHYLGMVKMAKTKYLFEKKLLSAKELIKLLSSRKAVKYSRSLHCYYAVADVELSGVRVRLFFCRRTKNADWNALLTTNYKLDFIEAYHIYSMRWSVEVFFKESKGLLGLGKSQSRDFAAQIASISVTVLQYNILSTVKRFEAYQTIGGLFNEATEGVIQLSVTDRIWGVLQELVRIIAETFETDDERVLDALINRSETFKHYINFDRLQIAKAA